MIFTENIFPVLGRDAREEKPGEKMRVKIRESENEEKFERSWKIFLRRLVKKYFIKLK